MNHPNIVWIDIETTGLNPLTDSMLEVACIVTDSNLNKLDNGLALTINFNAFDNIPDAVKTMHTKNNLISDCKVSPFTIREVETAILTYIKQHTIPNQSILAGSSIGFDKSFLSLHMPSIINHLHYRILDVSCFKNACNYWCDWVPAIKKTQSHRALDDINESITEMRYYKDNMFIQRTT